AGLAAYLLDSAERPSVVIGYDARHNSDVFATDTAEVMQAAGVTAQLLPGPVPTPVLAFAIGHLRCSAGVMVTASHNPPQDNGYKVYLRDGVQIVPPADAQIAAEIERVGRVDELARDTGYETLGSDVQHAYVDAVAALCADGPRDTDGRRDTDGSWDTVGPRDGPRDVVCAYTPMHGVGGATAQRVVAASGFPRLRVVAEQAEADPDFPTVSFPNPEEPGAMDLALELAAEVGADLVVANDPDADRCAVGVPNPEG